MLTDLERELIEALKTAHAHIANDAMRLNIGNIIARAEAKAKEPQCKCELQHTHYHNQMCGLSYRSDEWNAGSCINELDDGSMCAHDRACHSSAVEG